MICQVFVSAALFLQLKLYSLRWDSWIYCMIKADFMCQDFEEWKQVWLLMLRLIHYSSLPSYLQTKDAWDKSNITKCSIANICKSP